MNGRDVGRLESFIRGLPAHEALVLIALHAMIEAADADGWIRRSELVEQFRRLYLASHTRATEDGGPDARRLREIRKMSGREVDQYLNDQVLARLRAEGWLRSASTAEDGRVAFTPGVWAAVAGSRSHLLELLQAEVEHRLRVEPPAAAEPRAEGASRLSARSLVKVYRKRRVVNDVDLELRQGEIVGLLGPNGAGKTTTFYMIVGLIPPDEGHVYLDGEDLTHVPMYQRARRGIGYLSQEPSVFRKLTVEDNILAILETLGLSEEEREGRLGELLDELSIKHLRKNKAYSLSGGERRRLEITRALVTSPKFMLLDEPFAGIDPIAVDDIQRIVAGLRQRGLGVLITDHNVRETLSITDRAYIMFDGRIHLEGTSEQLVSDPEARKLYLGEDFRL